MQTVSTDRAPRAIGPYSQGIVAGGFVFASGQVPSDPATSELVRGPIAAQTLRALENVLAVVEAGGSSKERVVKVTVFLLDLSDFAAMNGAYESFFGSHRPARSTVQVARLPRDARIEVEAIAER